jgi:hypothetical protein
MRRIDKRNVLQNNDSKFRLVGKINGLSNEVKRARHKLISLKKNDSKWRYSYRKMVIGVDVRYHLLAYAFLRGKPYAKMERKCAESSKPSVEAILRIAVLHESSWNKIATPEKVEAWLKGEF